MAIDDLRTSELQKILDRAGSWKRFQEMLGLDRRQTNLLMAKHTLSLKKLGNMSLDQVVKDVERIGSVELFCIIHDCKPSELHSVLAKNNVSLKQLVNSVGGTSGIGRKGELYFKEVRGSRILEDCFETRGQCAPFDFRDEYYGLVNVKTASRQRYTAKTREKDPNYWHFSLSGWKDCDYLALVPLDPSGNPRMVIMMASKSAELLNADHLVLTGKDLLPSSGVVSPCAEHPSSYLLMLGLYKRTRGIETTQVQPVREAISE